MERRHHPKSPQEVLALCRERNVKGIDLRFTDLIGRQHHLTVPVSRLTEAAFEEGFGFDGSSLRGAPATDESDLLLVPQAATAWFDPFPALPTIVLTCDLLDPVTREEQSNDPRHVARRAENYLLRSGVADVAHFGPEVEFFILDQARFGDSPRAAYYELDSEEAAWSNAAESKTRFGTRLRPGEGYAPAPPLDQTADLRGEMMRVLIDCGVEVECHHHQIAAAGQGEIDIRHDALLSICDAIMTYKYVVRSVARQHGKTATFMPQPVMGDHGNGMHVHCSLWKGGEPLFAGTRYAGLSDAGLHAIGGILAHAPALLALASPTTNSYRRLAPGTDAPIHLGYAQRNRSAACRVPMVGASPKSKRIEFRCPDPSCNPYLALSAILMAVIDGIQNKIEPGEPMDQPLFELSSELPAQRAQTPRSLDAALEALEDDCDFLLRGDVFTEQLLAGWIDTKLRQEIQPLARRPHPHEFQMYFDC